MLNFRDFVTSSKAKDPHYLVIGHPIGHSLSPLMHRTALQYHGIDADYLAVDLSPADIAGFISWISRDQFLGANITIPYKREFLPVVDHLDETAKAAGAVNTLVKGRAGIHGYNTDIDGFLRPLTSHRDQLQGESIILFGSGGASQAVMIALEQLDAGQTVVVSRHPDQLSQDKNIILCNYQNWQSFAEESVMFVNCTPLGMFPETDRSPVEEQDIHLMNGKICYDLVYNPVKTRFLNQAENAGGTAIGGLEMFIGQGARAFELWTGRPFPVQAVQKILTAKLEV